MKKTFAAAALSSVLVLGLAGVAVSAEAPTTTGVVAKGASKLTMDGSVRERGMYDKDNFTKDTPGRTGYDSRVQLGVTAAVSDQATARILLENGAGNGDTEAWGTTANTNAALANGNLMNGGNKLVGLNILEAWVNYKPGVWGVKAGHMPLALGNKVFFDHSTSGDDALVFYADPSAATHVGALTIKFDEQLNSASFPVVANRPDNSDDLDGYVALVTHKVSDAVKLGANWTYLRGGDTAGALGAAGTELLQGLSMSNLGLTVDGKVGAISYMADAEIQFGTLAEGTLPAGADNTVDQDGWAAKIGADYDLGAGKIGLVFGYGTGNDTTSPGVDNDNDAFVNFLTDTTYDTLIAGFRAPISGAGWSNATGRNSGLSNLTLYQLKGSTKTVCPLTGKDLSILGSVSYMQLSEDIDNSATAVQNKVDGVGTEIDLIAKWSLTPGLTYSVEAGYLFVGDAYEVANGTADQADPDNLVFLRHGLDLKF